MDVDPLGPYLWHGVVHYGASSEGEITFDVSAGTQHITQSLETMGMYGPSGVLTRDNQGAIGVTDTSVEGVDILVPQFSFSETYIKDAGDVTTAYIQTLGELVGTVNASSFRGWQAGEVLFKGATGRRRSIGQWEITYQYAVSLNKTDITIGDITGIDKKGWEYLWVQYEEAEDTSAKALVRKPIQVNVEKVYENGDFSLLDIGTA